MDRSIGTLRSTLRKLGVADNTLIWFCSDNGGLPDIRPDTVGGLRGHKGTLYEGGLRVPAIIEWPSKIDAPRVTETPACTMDIFPTLLDVAGIEGDVAVRPQDGVSLYHWFKSPPDARDKPIPFRHQGRAAIIDNDLKLLTDDLDSGRFQLYDLADDPAESKNLADDSPQRLQRLKRRLLDWNRSVEKSVAGEDYPSGRVSPDEPPRRFWTEVEAYEPYFDQWKSRPEYRGRLKSVTE
jgi:arylsulfatase A-like enzyme